MLTRDLYAEANLLVSPCPCNSSGCPCLLKGMLLVLDFVGPVLVQWPSS